MGFLPGPTITGNTTLAACSKPLDRALHWSTFQLTPSHFFANVTNGIYHSPHTLRKGHGVANKWNDLPQLISQRKVRKVWRRSADYRKALPRKLKMRPTHAWNCPTSALLPCCRGIV